MERWQAQDQEWRGVDHGENDVKDQKGRSWRFVAFRCWYGKHCCIILALENGKNLPFAVYQAIYGGVISGSNVQSSI